MTARRIVILCDNVSSGPACACEWGLSLAVDTGAQGLWLWDTGQTSLFLDNARALGVDVTTARGLALSHGHYDHTGGLPALLGAGFRGAIYAHPACASERWAASKSGPAHTSPTRTNPIRIGPPAPLPAFHPAGPLTQLAPGLVLIADIPRAPGSFQAVEDFFFDQAGQRPDPVADDAFLVLDTAKGPVVILGCCHSGLANSLACAAQRLGHASFHAVLGGLHLYKAPPAAIDETAQALTRFGVQRLVAGHCTGVDRVEALRGLLPACAVEHLCAGQELLF